MHRTHSPPRPKLSLCMIVRETASTLPAYWGATELFAELLRIRPESTTDLLREVISHMADYFTLPACHSRRDYDAAARVYLCAHPMVHIQDTLITADICRICNRCSEPPPPRFREFPPGKHVVGHGPCFHLGEQTGLRDCPTCRGNVKVKLYACSHPHHQSTTISDCLRCADYRPRQATNPKKGS